MRTKCAQAQRIFAKEEAQPYAQLLAPTVDDEDDRADQLLKRTRLEEEAATTTTSSSSSLRSVSSVSFVLSPIGSASSVNASPVVQSSGAALFAVSPCVGGGGVSSLESVSSPMESSKSSAKKRHRKIQCDRFVRGKCLNGDCPYRHSSV